MPDEQEVVVTGMGAVTPLGRDVRSLWEALLAGRSGIGPITAFDASRHDCRIAGEVRNYDPPAGAPPELERSALFAGDAALQAQADAQLPLTQENAVHVGLVVGSAWPPTPSNEAVARVAAVLGVRGPSLLVSTAEASASSAIATAAAMIRRSEVQVAFAGGTDAPVRPELVARFAEDGYLSRRNDAPERACRPFDASADGFVLSEGAAVLVLESESVARERGARTYGYVAGTGFATEPGAVAPGVREAGRAMQLALRQPALLQGEIDYYCAFAPGSPPVDRMETQAVRRIFGELTASKLTLSSPKSMLGHLLGASGAVDAVVCLKAIEVGMVPPTVNLEQPAEGCDLDYTANAARRLVVRNAMCYAYGDRGHHVALCFSAP